MCKMNKWQYLPRDLWFLKWKALGASSPLADFGRLRTSSEDFGRLRTSSGIFGNDRVVFKNPSTPRIKISRLYLISEKVGRYRIASSPFEVYGVQAWLLTRGSKREITQNDEFSLWTGLWSSYFFLKIELVCYISTSRYNFIDTNM